MASLRTWPKFSALAKLAGGDAMTIRKSASLIRIEAGYHVLARGGYHEKFEGGVTARRTRSGTT
jgi:hypothetical protein